MRKRTIRRGLAFTLAILLSSAMAVGAVAETASGFAPVEVTASREGDTLVLTMLYEVPSGTATQEFVEPAPIYDGREYALREIRPETAEETEGSSMEITKTLSISSASDRMEDILKLLPESLAHSEEGYAGELLPDTANIQVEPEASGSFAFPVQETIEYTGLDRNDPSYITQTIEKDGITLDLVHIDWRPDSDENNMTAPTYGATATYAGTTTVTRTTSFRVTADYSGTVTRQPLGTARYWAVYECAADTASNQIGESAAAPDHSNPSPGAREPEADDGESAGILDILLGINLTMILMGVAAVMLLVFLVLILKTRKKTDRRSERAPKREKRKKQKRSRRDPEIPYDYSDDETEDSYGYQEVDAEDDEADDAFIRSVQASVRRDFGGEPVNRSGGRRKPEALEYLRRDGGGDAEMD